MKVVTHQLAICTLLLVYSAAQVDARPAAIQNFFVSRDGDNVRLEVVLSAPVQPSVEVAHHPERLLLQLPNTKDSSRRGRVAVGVNGVRSIHTVLSLEDGTSTQLVVELDGVCTYSMSAVGNRVILTMAPVTPVGRPVIAMAKTVSHPSVADPAVAKPALTSAPPQTPSGAQASTSVSSAAEIRQPSPDKDDRPALAIRLAEPALRTVFRVKYVAQGVAYLDGGRNAGLKEGVKLEVQESDLPPRNGTTVDPADPRVVMELEVTAVAETSSVTDIHSPKRALKVGDLAYLSSTDAEMLVQQNATSATRKYPAVVTFTEGDPLDEEVIAAVPRPPMPSVNRFRGRIGFDYMGTMTHGSSSMTSSNIGMIFRGDMTRIGGTYWNLSGYWRGRLTSQAPAGQQTLQDLINRTYHLSMTYDSPNSAWVAGFGRLYLPWAASLDTIDGGYFGRKMSQTATLGIFGGSTPDPTSWNYSPDRVIGGSFINFAGGDYSGFHYSSTMGGGVSMLKWEVEKPFGFLENSLSFSQKVFVYDSLQVDSPKGNPAVVAPGPGLSRNFLTLRVQPHPRVELDFNHTYFRDLPTFDPQLIGTGLLDKYLFQGYSGGARVEVWKRIFLYTQLGSSSRTGDAKSSLNQMYGITFGRLPWINLRSDFHYARFNSSFGDGSYKALSFSRDFTDNFRLEVLAGEQVFASALTSNSRYRFLTSNVETNLGSRYFIQGGYTANRGDLSYDQWTITLGLRFDSRSRRSQ